MEHEPEVIRRTLRFPSDVASYLEQVARARFTSQNAEAVRLIRQAMAGEAAGDEGSIKAPAASENTGACQGAQ